MTEQTLLQKGLGDRPDLLTYVHIDPSVIRKRVGEVTDDAVVVELWGHGTSAYAPVLAHYGGGAKYRQSLAAATGRTSLGRWGLTCWSAGGQFAKSVCAGPPEDWPDALVLLDAVYGKKPPGGRRGDGQVLFDAGLAALSVYAIDAARGVGPRTMVLFHSRISTSYASSKECCEAIQRRVEAELGQAMAPSTALTAEDLDGHRFVEALTIGNFHLVEFAGVDADEHVTEAHLYDEVWQKLIPWSRRGSLHLPHPPGVPLQQGSRGPEVVRWQLFLIGQGFDQSKADGDFGPKTADATQRFQARYGLPQTGMLDGATLSVAQQEGYPKPLPSPVPVDTSGEHKRSAAWPPPPAFQPLVGTAERQRVFGAFRYVPAPVPGNPEAIKILDDWDDRNIVRVTVPELGGIPYAPKDGAVLFHHKGADQLLALFRAWDQAGVRHLIKSWAGSWVPRFVRGSRATLSNHSFGSAFDLNAPQNPLGATPALVGSAGSVRELVPLANAHGFYWGGHFRGRPDGMHFELAIPGMFP